MDIRLRWNEYTYLIMGKYGFDNVRTRARWIGPLRLAECKLGVLGVFVDILRSVRWEFRSWTLIFCGMFATCSFCVCYMFAKQKYGFCRVKVWFLACKKGVFALQKYGFWFLNVMLLQIGRTHFVVERRYLTEYLPHYFNSPAALLADRYQP